MNSEQRSDEQLMLAFARGEVSAFDELFLRYWEKLRRFFIRRLDDRSRAEELAQDIFLIVFRAASRYEPRALFRTYLYAIALRVLRAERRQARLRALLFLREPSKEPAAPHKGDDGLWIRDALHRLPAKDREVLMLREYDELTYVEIATVLKMRVNTVRSRLFRARQALREILASEKNTNSPAVVDAQQEET
jgi:RNA polymerase sigma-70 factor (ECF subfamily)